MRHDDRIAILRLSSERDAAGEPVGGWVADPEIWANAQFPTGAAIMRAASDELRADAPVSVVRASFRIWADSSIDESCQVRYLGSDYKIHATVPDSADRRFVFLACARVK